MKNRNNIAVILLFGIATLMISANTNKFAQLPFRKSIVPDFCKQEEPLAPVLDVVNYESILLTNIALMDWLGSCTKKLEGVSVIIGDWGDRYDVVFVDMKKKNMAGQLGRNLHTTYIRKADYKIVSRPECPKSQDPGSVLEN